MTTIQTVSLRYIVSMIQTIHPEGYSNVAEIIAQLVALSQNGAFDKAGITVFEDIKASGRVWRTVANQHVETIVALWEAEYLHEDAIAHNLLSQVDREIRKSTRLYALFDPALIKAIRSYLDTERK